MVFILHKLFLRSSQYNFWQDLFSLLDTLKDQSLNPSKTKHEMRLKIGADGQKCDQNSDNG